MEKSITILLADDDLDDISLFRDALREVDDTIQFYTLSNGQEVLAYLANPSNQLPDYIFLDLRMPKMSGKKCLEQIRLDRRLKETPVIIYTTSDVVEDSEELTRMGATHFITKPTNPEEIYYLLSLVLNENWT